MHRTPTRHDGVYPALVTNHHDPLNMGRIKVRFPWDDDDAESHWARLVQPYAGKERGLYFVPEVGDEVLVIFELGDLNQPLVLGGTWNGVDPPPEPGDPDGQNDHKVIETRSGHTLVFGDKPGEEFIQLMDSSLQNYVRWDSKTDTMTVMAQTGDIIIRAPQGFINLLAKDVTLTATDSAIRKVQGNEQITVKQAATEIQHDKKIWKSNASLTGKSKTLTVAATDDLTVQGGSATVDATNQTAEDVFKIEGTTTDNAASVSVEAEVSNEKAESRTWTATSATFNCKSLTFDATGAFTMAGGLFNADASGQFSLFGDNVTLQGGLLTFKDCGSINFNPSAPPPPGPAIPGRLIARAAATSV